MSQTKIGAFKSRAAKAGCSVEEYQGKIDLKLKWCFKCKAWQKHKNFQKDRSRFDGFSPICNLHKHVYPGLSKSQALRKTFKNRKKPFVSPMKGKKMSEESRAKMKLSSQSKTNKHRLGNHHSIETRIKISEKVRLSSKRGTDSPLYKDGKVVERRGIRFSLEYKQWRTDVYLRDAYTCQKCGDNKGGNLNAHHIKEFALYPELRLNLDNGITLCKKCHKKQHAKIEKI